LARVDTLAGLFFWQAYRLPAKGESCAAFDQKDPGRSVAFGYLCRKGELPAATVATVLRDLDPNDLAAPSKMIGSTGADRAADVPGVPGWPFHLAQYQPIDER
jgi:hypothetical protein